MAWNSRQRFPTLEAVLELVLSTSASQNTPPRLPSQAARIVCHVFPLETIDELLPTMPVSPRYPLTDTKRNHSSNPLPPSRASLTET